MLNIYICMITAYVYSALAKVFLIHRKIIVPEI